MINLQSICEVQTTMIYQTRNLSSLRDIVGCWHCLSSYVDENEVRPRAELISQPEKLYSMSSYIDVLNALCGVENL